MNSFINAVEKVNSAINSFVWGPFMLALLIGTGLLLSFKCGFLQFTKFRYVMKHTVGELLKKDQHKKDKSGVSPVQAVSTAMAGTIGTGSIAGISTAIISGGPGAVFWMWVSALLGMATKYSEIVLSLKYREKTRSGQWVGGPMYYIKNGINNKWLKVVLSTLFSVFTMLACLGIGNATQSNSIAGALKSTLKVPEFITAIVLTVIAFVVILGGIKRIAAINEKFVPFMAVFYVFCSVVAILINIRAIPSAFALIFKEAFNVKAALGGAAGYGIMTAMKFGFARGVFSNEAGLGSAPIAHSASSAKEPVTQALWGMFEVFFTTIVICTLSALTILTSGIWADGKLSGTPLAIASYNSIIPGFGGIVITLSTIFFALSTILGWGYYGEVAAGFLTNNRPIATLIYRIVYVAAVYVGAVGNLDLIWSISETMNGLMAIPNLIALVSLSGVVSATTKEYFEKRKNPQQQLVK